MVIELIRQCVEENSRVGLDQAEYQKHYSGLVLRYEKAKARLEKIEEQRQARRIKQEQIDAFLETLNQYGSVLTEFDEKLWFAVIDKVTVYSTEKIEFTFKDGSVVKG